MLITGYIKNEPALADREEKFCRCKSMQLFRVHWEWEREREREKRERKRERVFGVSWVLIGDSGNVISRLKWTMAHLGTGQRSSSVIE